MLKRSGRVLCSQNLNLESVTNVESLKGSPIERPSRNWFFSQSFLFFYFFLLLIPHGIKKTVRKLCLYVASIKDIV